jgi:hypothetical protein
MLVEEGDGTVHSNTTSRPFSRGLQERVAISSFEEEFPLEEIIESFHHLES